MLSTVKVKDLIKIERKFDGVFAEVQRKTNNTTVPTVIFIHSESKLKKNVCFISDQSVYGDLRLMHIFLTEQCLHDFRQIRFDYLNLNYKASVTIYEYNILFYSNIYSEYTDDTEFFWSEATDDEYYYFWLWHLALFYYIYFFRPVSYYAVLPVFGHESLSVLVNSAKGAYKLIYDSCLWRFGSLDSSRLSYFQCISQAKNNGHQNISLNVGPLYVSNYGIFFFEALLHLDKFSSYVLEEVERWRVGVSHHQLRLFFETLLYLQVWSIRQLIPGRRSLMWIERLFLVRRSKKGRWLGSKLKKGLYLLYVQRTSEGHQSFVHYLWVGGPYSYYLQQAFFVLQQNHFWTAPAFDWTFNPWVLTINSELVVKTVVNPKEQPDLFQGLFSQKHNYFYYHQLYRQFIYQKGCQLDVFVQRVQRESKALPLLFGLDKIWSLHQRQQNFDCAYLLLLQQYKSFFPDYQWTKVFHSTSIKWSIYCHSYFFPLDLVSWWSPFKFLKLRQALANYVLKKHKLQIGLWQACRQLQAVDYWTLLTFLQGWSVISYLPSQSLDALVINQVTKHIVFDQAWFLEINEVSLVVNVVSKNASTSKKKHRWQKINNLIC